MNTLKHISDFGQNVEQFIDQEQLRFEGYEGVRSMNKLVKTLGYGDLNEFLSDNQGCMEAMVNWITNQQSPEWAAAIEDHVCWDPEYQDEEEYQLQFVGGASIICF